MEAARPLDDQDRPGRGHRQGQRGLHGLPLSMVVPSVSAVFRFEVLPLRSLLFYAFRFAVSAIAPFRKRCFPFRGPR